MPIISRSLSLVHALALVCGALALACGQATQGDEAGHAATTEKSSAASANAATASRETAAVDESALVSGSVVSIPSAYRGLELGMSIAEAQAIHPGMPDEDTIKDPRHPDVYFVVGFDKGSQRVSRFYFSLPGDSAKSTVSSQWGEGLRAQGSDEESYLWFHPDGGIRASLKPGFGSDWDLEFTSYIPYTTFLGASSPTLAFQSAAPLLGKSADEIRRDYADVIVELSLEQAKAARAKVEAMLGGPASGLAPPAPSLYLSYPPTEYESFWTRVNFGFDAQQRVNRVFFSLPFEQDPRAQDKMLALFKAKWGEPTPGRALGMNEDEGDKESLWVFTPPAPHPRVEARLNATTHAWELAVRAAP